MKSLMFHPQEIKEERKNLYKFKLSFVNLRYVVDKTMKTFIPILFVCFNAKAQYHFAGKIYDAKTGQVLSFANVFVSNTTIGVNTAEKDILKLKNYYFH